LNSIFPELYSRSKRLLRKEQYMKKLCIVLGIVLLVASVAVADRSVLIDFAELVPDVTVGPADEPNQHEATLVDFSGVAGASYDEDMKKQMKSSLAIENWSVQLATSSRTVQNQTLSYTKMAPLKADAKPFDNQEMGGLIVMGVRVHFPLPNFNSYAMVVPPFEIPAYAVKDELRGDTLVPVEGDAGTKFDGYGVVKNVGVLKSLEMTVYGSNFPNGVGVILKDQDGREQTIFLDYLEFDGWRKLVWNNPNYITEVRNREVRKFPLYPKSAPFAKLVGLIIYRNAMQEGGDIITYFKDISITYDKALLETQRDVNDEAIWGILGARQEARQKAELRRLGEMQVLRAIEKQKMHKEEE
jgi:hypothetical protein